MSSERVVRIYRTLIGLYPRAFREEYGADMVRLLRDQCNDEPTWKVFGRSVVDLVVTLPIQRLETHMNRTPTSFVPILFAAIAGAGTLLAIMGGTNIAMLIVGLCVAVVAAGLGAVTWRRTRPIGEKLSTSGWWKFLVAGPCIVVAVIVAAELGVEAWFVGVLCVFAALVVTGIGLLLGVAHLSSRRSTPLTH